MTASHLEVNGTRLFLEDSGETDLPTVLCLHSLFLDGRMFDEFATAARGRYRVVRPDFRGQGRSAPAAEPSIGLDTCADDVVAVCERLGLGRSHLLVQSMGGDVGVRVAARRPDLVRSMVMLGSSARSEPPDQLENFRGWVRAVESQGFTGEVLETTMAIMFGETTRQDPAKRDIVDLWRGRIAAVPPSLAPAMSGVIERASVLDLLADITAPVLVVSGAEDLPRPPEWADEVVTGLPNAELWRLTGIGHSPILEAPELVLPRLLEFFAREDAA